jgi:hypothetical protein
VQEHERRRVEALDERRQQRRVGARQQQVGVAEAAVHLDRQRVGGVGLERVAEQQVDQRLGLEPPTAGAQRRRRRGLVGAADVEPGAVGRDRLQAGVAAAARAGDLGTNVLAQLVQPEAAGDPLLGHSLDAHDGTRASAGQLSHPLPALPLAGRREAVIDQQPLGAGGAEHRRRVGVRIGRAPVREHGILGGLAAQHRRQLRDRAAVGQAGGHVRPLARVGALGEQAAELVERRRRTDDPVRVVVDERDGAQYFSK